MRTESRRSAEPAALPERAGDGDPLVLPAAGPPVTAALVAQFFVTLHMTGPPTSTRLIRLASFFTIQSNVLVCDHELGPVPAPGPERPAVARRCASTRSPASASPASSTASRCRPATSARLGPPLRQRLSLHRAHRDVVLWLLISGPAAGSTARPCCWGCSGRSSGSPTRSSTAPRAAGTPTTSSTSADRLRRGDAQRGARDAAAGAGAERDLARRPVRAVADRPTPAVTARGLTRRCRPRPASVRWPARGG